MKLNTPAACPDEMNGVVSNEGNLDFRQWLVHGSSRARALWTSLFEGSLSPVPPNRSPIQRSTHGNLKRTAIHDLTKRRRTERRLQETLDRFKLLVDSVDGILWESDVGSLYSTFVSRQAEQLLGYPVERWLTEPGFWRDHIHPEDREQTIARFEEEETRLQPFRAEYRMIAADGREVWIRDIVMVTEKDGRPAQLHGVMVDFTERKRIEVELERARDYYFTVLDKLPDPVWQTGPDGESLYVNKAWQEFTGGEPGKGLREHWLDTIHPEDHPLCQSRYLAAVESRSSFHLDYRARHADGSYHEVRNHGRPLFFMDQFMGYLGTIQDLHSLRTAESGLLRVKDLYAALSQTDQLIIHAPDRSSLFRDICIIATHQAKFALAWVGLVNPQTSCVEVAASDGPVDRFPDGFQVTADDDHPLGRGPTGTCIREGVFQVVNDFIGDDAMTPWLGFAEDFGIRSAASFPLWCGGKVIGALTLYSKQAGFFEQDRVELLNEMAQDLSFALDHLAAEEGRKEVAKALRESEANLARAQEIAQMGSWIWDVAQNRGQWSAGMEKIYGFTIQEGPGHLERVLQAVHPEDRVRYQTRLLKLITTGGETESDYRILRPDGEERVFVVHAVAERMADGPTTLVRGITYDITERRRVEEKVRETLRHLEDLKAAVDESAIVLITGADGVITYVNRRMCEISGYSQAELIGQRPSILDSRYHPHAFFQEMWEIISAGGIWRNEVRNRAKDGALHWLNITIVPFLDEGGNPIQYMSISFDITNRKLAEEQILAISAERMALLDAASVAKVVPWSMDLATGNLRMGDSALLVLGKPALTFQAHPNALRELLRAEDQKLLLHAQAEARAGLLGCFEAPLRRGEKQIIWSRWTIGRREDHLYGVVQDITEQHELYSQLLQSQKLESLGTLVSGITHDFNNILMGILGYTEVLSAMTDLPPSALKGIGVIGRAAERGRGLVNQLLRFSRRTVATKVMHNLNDIAREIQTLMQLPGDQRIELQLQLDPELPDTLMDPGQINQVAMNLAVNARDAITGRGVIQFRTGQTVLRSQEASEQDRRPGSYVFLEIEDTGAGIRPEMMSRIFEPFFTTKGIGKGTGLGLSVVHGIVEAHNGHIQCKSEVGEGTCFRVMLPRITADSLSQDLEHLNPAQTGHRILLLDDKGHPRSTAADLLVYMGNQVLAESDVPRAIEAHHAEPFQLVVLNLEMAEGSGLLVLKTLQDNIPEVPIIAGASMETPDFRSLKHQPHALIQWPFQAVELLSAIQRVLG